MIEDETEHAPIPVWSSTNGQRYCSRHGVHGAWVAWPCEDSQ